MSLEEIRKIVNQLNQWSYEYYVLDTPTVTDKEYDALYDRLVLLEQNSGTILSDSPTLRVGGEPIKKFKQYTHKKRLYSLDKVQSFNKLEEWINKICSVFPKTVFSLEYKFDGLTINLSYDNGAFVRGTTRGNGVVGEDITEQVKTIKSIPLKVNCKTAFEVQGEGIIKLSQLKKFNELYPNETLKNARNGVAGAIRNLDPKVTAKRNLDAVFYSLGDYNFDLSSQNALISFLTENKFKTSSFFKLLDNYEQIKLEIENIAKLRDGLDFLIDGVVIKVNDFTTREILGYTEKFPKWAVAFKFEAEEVTTKLIDVEWQVGRTGKLTPLGILEPVELCGATIQRATLNNFGDIVRKKLKTNALVFIRRSNDVIPEVLDIAEVYPDSSDIIKPEKCPFCKTTLIENGAHIFCPNKLHCRPQIVARLTHYCSKPACDIEYVSDKTVEIFVDKLQITKNSQLYHLKYNDFINIDGFKDKKIKNVLTSIKNSIDVKLPNFIYSLGIDNIGIKTATDLADIFKDIDNLKNASYEQLIEINEVGPAIANSIINFFKDDLNTAELYELNSLGINPKVVPKNVNGIFNNLKVVLTGSLSNFTRSQAEQLIVANGGEVSSSVSKKTNIVLVGENAGSKKDDALKLGTKIMDELEFMNLLKTIN